MLKNDYFYIIITIIKKIAAAETYSVRLPVLRNGKPIGSCRFDGDDLETTQHFGLFLDSKLVGIISLFKQNNPTFSEKHLYQIRRMTVLEKHRKKDFGKALIIYSE